jgi:hypothetical protein
VIKTLKAKMGLIESVLGKRLKADEDSDMVIDVGTSEIASLFDGLLEDAKNV